MEEQAPVEEKKKPQAEKQPQKSGEISVAEFIKTVEFPRSAIPTIKKVLLERLNKGKSKGMRVRASSDEFKKILDEFLSEKTGPAKKK